MDLEGSSKPEYVDDEEEGSSTLRTTPSLRENGDVSSQEQHKFGSSVRIDLAERIGEVVSPAGASMFPKSAAESERNKESVLNSGVSSLTTVSAVATTPASTKGQGLRKWRRRRRHVSKNGTSNAESAQILKRRFPTTETLKAPEENKVKSRSEDEDEVEISVASPGSQNARLVSFPDKVFLNQELELLASIGFCIGMDSDNSEDRSSKSSTAVSAPRLKHELLGFGKERGNAKNLSERDSAHVVQQRGQHLDVGAVDSGTKCSDNFKFDKENSYSSVESELQRSPVGVVRQGSTASINGNHGIKSLNFDGEYSDEGSTLAGNRLNHCTENRELENPSGEQLDDELLDEGTQNSVNYQPPSDYDPFAESIANLQEAQEALENEVQKIAALGRETVFEDTDSQLDGTETSSCPTLDLHMNELNRKVEHLESMLEDAAEKIKAKEQKVIELEAIICKAHLLQTEDKTHQFFLQEHLSYTESELEALIRKAMEAEIEYLILTRTSQNWKVLAEDQFALFEEQRSLCCGYQEQMMQNLRQVEQRASHLKDQSERLAAYSEELSRTEKVLTLQNQVMTFEA
ncbi:hypothetical protein HPP92_022810 [Vanilla planifolia]|uniref:Uncharacterized protein n=1 Tax=Vanilla planifolia TaxID=51239 RepID=A0A835PUT9_VANPL|nr:hypothetical protein HPP92_022810 [Vanilla planifolia]